MIYIQAPTLAGPPSCTTPQQLTIHNLLFKVKMIQASIVTSILNTKYMSPVSPVFHTVVTVSIGL